MRRETCNNMSRVRFRPYATHNTASTVHCTTDAVKFSSGNPRNSNYNLSTWSFVYPVHSVESRIAAIGSLPLLPRKEVSAEAKWLKNFFTTWLYDGVTASRPIHESISSFQYVLMMSEAILVLATGNFLTRRLSHRANKHLHWILQAIGLILNLVGIIMIYRVKGKHFRSIHAIMGLSSLVIVCVVTICGYPVWIAWKLRRFVRPVVVKLVHDFLGIAGFVIGMATQCYGYKKNWLYNVTQVEHIGTIMLVLTALITVLSLRGALVSLGRKVADVLS